MPDTTPPVNPLLRGEPFDTFFDDKMRNVLLDIAPVTAGSDEELQHEYQIVLAKFRASADVFVGAAK